MNELIKNRSGLMIGGVLVISAVSAYFILYAPLIKRISKALDESRALQTELSQTRKLISPYKNETIKAAISDEKGISLTLNELTRYGLPKGIKFVSITPRQIEASQDPRYKIAPIEMEIESSYEALGMFLGSLNKLKTTLVTLRSLTVVPDDKNPMKLETKLVLNAYIAGGADNE